MAAQLTAANSRAYNGDTFSDGPSSQFGALSWDALRMSVYVTLASQTNVGKTTIGASTSTSTANLKRANAYAFDAGNATSMSAYLRGNGGSGSQAYRGVIYADASGSPSALVASTNEIAS